MKTKLFVAALACFLSMGIASAQRGNQTTRPARPGTGLGIGVPGTNKNCPGFVDANNNGICDNYENGTCTGNGTGLRPQNGTGLRPQNGRR